ncbi:hypothetical protein MLD38_035639 [Melastoma candidum]|uniref:Uncharacterized protein n=1 Tax=Melastoma candidum TaxID=119954 RepID=A0ACB9LH64_9MYRT|nr:hypothetical protein MLD38_035639 [Melastoma candidum]
MVRNPLLSYAFSAVFATFLVLRVSASTDQLEVAVLHELYGALNFPSQLKGWRPDGWDPCGESWTGVACSGSTLLYLNLGGLNLSGNLPSELHNLRKLKQLDVSCNYISGDIPYSLPSNLTHLNLSSNKLGRTIPSSLILLKNLRHLNLSHNQLTGPIGDVFSGLQNLKEMDLSYNNFTGDLPKSFESLSNLTDLYLQHNDFTGAVTLLSNLPLIDLNIQENHFSGVLPKNFQYIPNLWMDGNSFHATDSSPWSFPFENAPVKNISTPPTQESSAIERIPSSRLHGEKKRKKGATGNIVLTVGGGTLIALCAVVALVVAVHAYRTHASKIRKVENGSTSFHTLTISPARESPGIFPYLFPPARSARHAPLPLAPSTQRENRMSFSWKKTLESAKVYNMAEIQLATKGFSEDNLICKGSLGSLYKAEFENGKTLAVKNINLASLSFQEEEQFLDVLGKVYNLRHQNIVPLVGHCIENGQHLLVYEHVRYLTLDEALHGTKYKPLSWRLRVRIGLGISRALDYMHSKFSPPVAHGNLKAGNVLIDKELRPRLCDCGLAVLRPLTSNTLKIKASEFAIEEAAYCPPEHGRPGNDSTKSDIYALGVLFLELLTGRKPFDSSRECEDRHLVTWASLRLHDRDHLEQMVDPGINPETLSPRAVSRFADIISLCIQQEKEFRPAMHEIVEYLTQMLRKTGIPEANSSTYGSESEHCDKSFRSSHTCFLGSPLSSSSSSVVSSDITSRCSA